MKMILLVLTFLLSFSAHAFDTISCAGQEALGTSKNVVLKMTALDELVEDMPEGEPVGYSLLLKNGNEIVASLDVEAAQEDVVFRFQNEGSVYGDISGVVYMDELDQTSVTINEVSYYFDCEVQYFDRHRLIAAVVQAEEGIEVWINTRKNWNERQSLVDSYSRSESDAVSEITRSLHLCNLAESSYEPCRGDRTIEQLKTELQKEGVEIEASFQAWAENEILP